MTPPAILERLNGVQRARNGWVAFCPAHDDRMKRSLSVSLGDDGKTLLHCFRGCNAEQIARAVNMSLEDLAGSGNRLPTRREIASYDYRDERGHLLYQVVRFEPKDFRPCRPDGGGGRIWGLGDVRRIVYRLDELADASSSLRARRMLIVSARLAFRLRQLQAVPPAGAMTMQTKSRLRASRKSSFALTTMTPDAGTRVALGRLSPGSALSYGFSSCQGSHRKATSAIGSTPATRARNWTSSRRWRRRSTRRHMVP